MRVLIFTEAGQKIGFGHFTRMSGICERLTIDDIPVTMYLEADEVSQKVLTREYVILTSWIEDINNIFNLVDQTDIVIVDCYKIDLDFLNQIKNKVYKLIVVDDNIRLDYENMIILNPNYFSKYLEYPLDKNNTYYLGKDYTLLRQEITSPIDRSVREKVKEVLITLGGTDVLKITETIMKYCHKIAPNVILNVVATEAFENLNEIKKELHSHDNLYISADAKKMNYLMNNVDFTIASGGGTSNELIKTQCPSILIKVADNQRLNLMYLEQHNYFMVFDKEHMDKISDMFVYENRKSILNTLKKERSDKTAADIIKKYYWGN